MLYLFLAVTILPGILGCCLPDQVSAIVRIPALKAHFIYGMDYTLQREYSRSLSNGTYYYTLMDYKKKSSYIVYDSGYCSKRKLRVQHVDFRCIPKTAKSVQLNLGPAGSLGVTSSKFKWGRSDVIFTRTTDKCLPVMTSFGGPLNYFYTNVTDTISDLTEFNDYLSKCS